MAPPISELRVRLGPPFGWLRVFARYRLRCSGCGAEVEEDIVVLAEWLDRGGSTAQRSVAHGVTCCECGALDPLDVPLLQLRGADGVGLVVGLPARTASVDDEAAIRDVLAVAGSARPLADAGVVAAIRMAWWGALWNRPLGPRLAGVVPLVLPETDEEAERWRLATVDALGLPDPGGALAKFLAADSDALALRTLADHPELTDPRWRLTVEILVEQLREAQPSEEAVAALDDRAGLVSRARLLGPDRAAERLVPALAALVDTATSATDVDERVEALDALREAAGRDDLDAGLHVAVGLAWLEARHGARDRQVTGGPDLLADARATSQLANAELGPEHEMAMQADLNLAAFIEDVAESAEELGEAETLLARLGERAARVGSTIVIDAATNLATVVARRPGTRADNPLDAAECLADARFMRPLLRGDPARDEIVALIDEAATLRSRVSGSLRDNAKEAVALIRTALAHQRWQDLSPADQALSLSNLANALHQLHARWPDETGPEEVRGAARDALDAARKLDPHNPVAMQVMASSGASLIHLYTESAVEGIPDVALWREGTDALEAAFEATREAYPPHHPNVLVAALNLASAHGSPIDEQVANPERCAELLQYVIERSPPSEAEARMKAAMNLGQLRIGQGSWPEAADALQIAAEAHDRLLAGARLFSTRLGEIVDAGDLAARRALALIGAERYREAVDVLEASRARLRPGREPENEPNVDIATAVPGRALVHLATCGYGTFGVVALPDGRFAPFTRGLNSRRLKPLVGALLQAADPAQRREAFDRLADVVGPAVVSPVLAALDAAEGALEEVVIVACGTLATCPVTRIPDERGRALIALHPIREAVSVRALRGTSPSSAAAAALAVIDPDGDLPYARAEREALGGWAERIEEPPRGRPVAAWLVAALPHAKAAHLACHGRFDPHDPMRSTFRLGGQETLTVADLAELQLPDLELVVAPACQSASAGPDAPDELLGVAHMLAHAGARHVIASLWDADDATTALTIARLYKELAAGEPPHNALRRAQLWVSTVSGPELAAASRRRLQGSDEASWLPYDLAIEFSARSAHPSYRSSDRPVFGHPALWATLSCLDS